MRNASHYEWELFAAGAMFGGVFALAGFFLAAWFN